MYLGLGYGNQILWSQERHLLEFDDMWYMIVLKRDIKLFLSSLI